MLKGASLGNCSRDLKFAVRLLSKNPGFTAATVLTLALGIGANTAMFSVVDAVLLRPLPYKDADRLMMVWEKSARVERNSVAPANYLDWREQNQVFSELAGLSSSPFNLNGRDLPERIEGAKATWNVFQMLGVTPVLGRGFVPEDDLPGAPQVAILSYGLWQRRFGGDLQIAGRTISLDGAPCTIVGVLPAQFRSFFAPEIFVPLALDRGTASREFHYLFPVGRLKPGVSRSQAQAEMEGIARRIAAAHPETNEGWSVFLEPVREAAMQGRGQSLLVLFGAVGLLLLIACVNVANLLMAKAAVRERELALRASLGAGRGRLIAQLLIESIVLALAGGVLGVVLAAGLVRVLPGLVPAFALSGFTDIGVDARVLAFTLLLSVLTGALFGLFPAWRATHVNLHEVLKAGGRGSSGAYAHAGFRSALVVVEIALSLMLLAGAGLMVRSLMAISNLDPGFRLDHLLTMRLSMADAEYRDANMVRSFYRQVLANVEAIPGVRGAALSMGLPLQGAQLYQQFQILSHPPVPDAQAPGAPFEIVSPGFFRTLGIPLLTGRLLADWDDEKAPPVAVVNEAFVRRFLTGEQPIGQRLLMDSLVVGTRNAGPHVTWQIVGVIGNARYSALSRASGSPEIYVPVKQSPWLGAALVLRTQGEPLALAQSVRAAVARVNRDTPVTAVKTMEQIAADSISQSRAQTWLIGGFAVVALVMAALGIYGLVSYSVTQSLHDMGVRIALGASAGHVLGLVMRRTLVLTGLGLVFGLAGGLASSRLLASLLFNTKPTDLVTFTAMSVLLTVVALVAGLIPALRATRIDPLVALRAE